MHKPQPVDEVASNICFEEPGEVDDDAAVEREETLASELREYQLRWHSEVR